MPETREPADPKEEEMDIEDERYASLEFGSGGHKNEYIFWGHNLENGATQKECMRISGLLKAELGEGWGASHRGTRIEILSPAPTPEPEYEKVKSALEKVFGDRYKIHVK